MARCCCGWGKKKDLVELQADGRKILNPLAVLMRNLHMKYALFIDICSLCHCRPSGWLRRRRVDGGHAGDQRRRQRLKRRRPPLQRPSTTPEAETDWDGILGTTVLRPGSQRVAFLLVGAKALVTVPEVEVVYFLCRRGRLCRWASRGD